MTQRDSYERAHSEVSAFELEDVANERLPLDRSAYTILPTIVTDELASAAATSIDLGQHNTSTSHILESEIEQDEPEVTGTLKRSAFYEWFSTMFDVFLSLIPLFFLVIAVLCLFLDKKPVSTYGQNVKALTLLSPTIFPIVYAAILGKLLRRIALFKAEKGFTIDTLEQLIGSQSLFTSIERQFGLRRINLLGLAIVIAWVLSPLDRQSSLRSLSTQPFSIPINTTLQYQSVEGFDNRTLFGMHMTESSWASYAPSFMTALQTALKYAGEPRDLFGNLRIPDVNSVVSQDVFSQNASEWHAVQNVSNLAYTSLFGVPVVDIPPSGNVTFTLESSYWEIHCDPFAPGAPIPANASIGPDPYHGKLKESPFGPSFLLHEDELRIDHDTPPAGNNFVFSFLYPTKTTFAGSSRGIMTANCTASFRLVESGVDCEAGDCSVQRMRHSNRDMSHIFHSSDLGNKWSYDMKWVWYFACLCSSIGGATRSNSHRRSSELPEMWMANPDSVLGSSGSAYYFVNLTTLPPEVFSRRLQVVMNTFWDATLNSTYRTGNLTSQGLGNKVMSSWAWNATNALGSRYGGDQYICNTAFAALTIVISLLLFTAASISVLLGIVTKAPDILGYVSSLARDDSYFRKTRAIAP